MNWPVWDLRTGDAAWQGIAACQLYYANSSNSNALLFAKQIAADMILLQADNGGIRMSPQTPADATAAAVTNYNTQSTENNISAHVLFRMLYQITGDSQYQTAMGAIENYMRTSVWNSVEKRFDGGMHYVDGAWACDHSFYSDANLWAILEFGAATIDGWPGNVAGYRTRHFGKAALSHEPRGRVAAHAGLFSGTGSTPGGTGGAGSEAQDGVGVPQLPGVKLALGQRGRPGARARLPGLVWTGHGRVQRMDEGFLAGKSRKPAGG